MAINPQKLLPPAKISSSIIKAPQSVIKPSNVSSVGSSSLIDNITIIKTKVIQIEDILKGTLASEKKALDQKKRQESGKRREEQEEKLEKKPNAEKGKIEMPSAPRMGIFGWIKNFIGNVILGYFAVRLVDHLPKIMPIVKFLGTAADFVINVGGNLLNGLVTFVDFGYKAYDATRGFIKNLGGENFAQGFDKFVGAIDTALFLTTVLAADLALEAATGGSDGGGPGGGRSGRDGAGPGGGFGQRGSTWQGLTYRQILREKGIEPGSISQSDNVIMKRYFQRYGRDAFVQRFGQEGLERLPSGMARSGLTKFARNAFVGVLGKGGAKAVLGTVRPLLKRLPIIGALIDFGLSVALGEDPGRAAFKAIGAGLLGSVGAAIGSVVPIAGNIVGGLLGGMAGDAIGGALYDMFFNNKKPQQKNQKIQKKAGGGITRGGKTQGGVRRTIGGAKKKGKYKRVLAQKPTKTEIKTEDKTLKETGEQLDKTKYFGPILAIASKIMAKQEPTQKDYENVGLGINLLISKGIEEDQLKGGLVAAFAEGGMVDSEFLEAAEKGSDISNWVAKTFKGEIESNAQKTLRLIKERREKTLTIEPQQDTSGEFLSGSVPGGQLSMEQLVGLAKGAGFSDSEAVIMAAIAKAESGGNSNAKNFKPPDKSYGLWQVNMIGRLGPARLREFGLQREDQLFDPVTNAKAAYAIRKSQGLSAWTVYKTGKYKNYLSAAQSAKNAPSLRTSPTLSGSSIELGKGYGSEGSKIAGELGRFMKKKGVVPGSIHRHPEHPPYSLTSGHSRGSLHYQGRAIDLGGYANEQGPILAAIAEFNRLKGVKPVQLLHAGNEPRNHSDHVHVAYHRGKVRSGRETIARILKDEKVLDTDTSKSLDMIDPLLAYKLNKASTKEGVLRVLQSYAGYEQPYAEPEIIEIPVEIPVPVPMGGGSSGGAAFVPVGGGSDPFETLYQGG